MKKVCICLAVVGIITGWSCAVTDLERTTNLGEYKSFGWGKSNLNVDNPAYTGDLIASSIKANIKNEFAKKGVSYDPKKPDLLVSYEGYTETKERIYGSANYYPYAYPYHPLRFSAYDGYMMGWPPLWSGTQGSYSYTYGTLIVDMRDRKTGKLVWRGVVQGNVDNVKTLKKNISKGIKAIMKKYPAAPPPMLPLPKEKIS